MSVMFTCKLLIDKSRPDCRYTLMSGAMVAVGLFGRIIWQSGQAFSHFCWSP